MKKTPDQVLRELLKAQGVTDEPKAKTRAIFNVYTQEIYDMAQRDIS